MKELKRAITLIKCLRIIIWSSFWRARCTDKTKLKMIEILNDMSVWAWNKSKYNWLPTIKACESDKEDK